MQGFQPVYSGNTLTQAYGNAGGMIIQAAQAQSQAMQSVGKSIGEALASPSALVGQMLSSKLGGLIGGGSQPVSEGTIKAAQDLGVDFGPRERVDTGGGDSGIQQFKPVTQEQYDRAMANFGRVSGVQQQSIAADLNYLNAQKAVLQLEDYRRGVTDSVTGGNTLLDRFPRNQYQYPYR